LSSSTSYASSTFATENARCARATPRVRSGGFVYSSCRARVIAGSSAGGTRVPKPVCTTGWRTPGMSLLSTGTPASMATACTIPNASKAFTDGRVNTSSEA
jgi:hypothetical protein